MKKLSCLLLVLLAALSLILTPAAPALAADTAAQKITFTYAGVVNKDYDVSDYTAKGGSRVYEISIEGRLIDYLLANNKDVKITIGDKAVIAIPAAALDTAEYIEMKKSGNAFTQKIKLTITKDSSIYDYYAEAAMNSKGLYADPKLSFEVSGTIVSGGMTKYELTTFAAPATITQPYVWGVDTYMPASQNETMLRYYLIDIDHPDRFGNYTWTLVGGTVDKAKDKLSGSFTKMGVYCGVSSKSHLDTGASPPPSGGPTVSATGFSDMAGHWAENDVLYLQKKNVVLNKSGSFLPQANISRAEFAVFITRIIAVPAGSGDLSFTDLDHNAYYYAAVLDAYAAGLISGKSETVFAPQDALTRQEMAALILRALQKANKAPGDAGGVLNGFTDRAAISAWAAPSCAAAVKAGLMVGKAGANFRPQDTTTRAEAAVILARLYRYLYQ